MERTMSELRLELEEIKEDFIKKAKDIIEKMEEIDSDIDNNENTTHDKICISLGQMSIEHLIKVLGRMVNSCENMYNS
jgi:uncharacterized lipoprotein YehR (DUF1307 family)